MQQNTPNIGQVMPEVGQTYRGSIKCDKLSTDHCAKNLGKIDRGVPIQ